MQVLTNNLGIADLTVVNPRPDLLNTSDIATFCRRLVTTCSLSLVYHCRRQLHVQLPILSAWIAGEVMRGLLSTHCSAKVAVQDAIANRRAHRHLRYPG